MTYVAVNSIVNARASGAANPCLHNGARDSLCHQAVWQVICDGRVWPPGGRGHSTTLWSWVWPENRPCCQVVQWVRNLCLIEGHIANLVVANRAVTGLELSA